MTHRLPAIRATAALFVALFASAPLVASLHAEDHAHVYCAEHQTIEESAGAASVVPVDATKQGWSAQQEDGTSHRSCDPFAVSARAAIVASNEGLVVLSQFARCPGLLAEGRAHEVVSVLFEAPKASPPQA